MRLGAMAGILALAGAGLGGCVTAKPYTTPDGRAGHVAYCYTALSPMENCHRKARETCGGDYEVLAQDVVARRMEFVCTTK